MAAIIKHIEAALDLIRDAARIGRELQGTFTTGTSAWHRLETLDDRLHDAVEQLDGDTLKAEVEARAPAKPAELLSQRIDAAQYPPSEGLIVKGWKNGAVWAGHNSGTAKSQSCDWWFPIPD